MKLVQRTLAPVLSKAPKPPVVPHEHIDPMLELYNRDSTVELPASGVGAELFDLVWFDPMFKPQSTQNNYKPFREATQEAMIEPIYPDRKTYNKTFLAWVTNAVTHVKPSGWIVIKLDDYTFAECWPILKRKTAWAKNVIWNKGRIGTGRMFRGQHELLVFCRPKRHKNTFFQAPSVFGKTGNLGKKSHQEAISSVWTVKPTYDGNNQYGHKGKHLHINETPLKLYDRLFKAFVPRHGSVLDLCMGSGSLGKKARQCQCRYVGFEVQPEIFNVAVDGILHTAPCHTLGEYMPITRKSV